MMGMGIILPMSIRPMGISPYPVPPSMGWFLTVAANTAVE